MDQLQKAIFIACAALLLRPATAQDPKALSPFPAGNFRYAGDWACEGTFRGGKTHKAVFAASAVLNGKWLELREEDTEPKTGYVAEYLIGYDSQAKRLVEFDANNFGAATYSSAEGWRENVLTMSSALLDDPKAAYVANRFVYSVTGSDSFTVDWQISKTSSLEWVTADHLGCKRRPAA